jgi:hypothetical protein
MLFRSAELVVNLFLYEATSADCTAKESSTLSYVAHSLVGTFPDDGYLEV